MLSFEIVRDREIQIYLDRDGMATLVEALQTALSPEGHVHLRAPAGGGRELSDTNPWGTPAVTQVIITGADDGEDP